MKNEDKKTSLMIGLCDDEIYTHDKVTKLMSFYEKESDVVICLVHYKSAQELLEANDKLDVLLLDIEMAEMDGIDAAYKLRNRGMDYKIVMLSAREDRYRDAFKIGAFRFVPKPIEERELYKAIDDVREHLLGLDKVTVFRDNIAYQITERDIIYIEANRASTIIYTQNFEYRSENSLTTWSEILDERIFFRCHRSYIVNIGKIEEIGKDTIILATGDKVSVSRRIKAALLNAFMIYDTSHR